MKFKVYICLTILTIISYSCNDKSKETLTTAPTNKEAEETKEYIQLTEEQETALYDSLIGKMPRMEIRPYIDSLQGKDYEWEYPENWKFKEKDAIAMLQSWNTAHNNHDAVEIVNHYHGDYYTLYGREYERSEAIILKQNLFKKYSDFEQQIVPGSIKFDGNENFIDRIDFQKSVTMNGKKQVYNSYLVFGTTQGATGIIEEGDVK